MDLPRDAKEGNLWETCCAGVRFLIPGDGDAPDQVIFRELSRHERSIGAVIVKVIAFVRDLIKLPVDEWSCEEASVELLQYLNEPLITFTLHNEGDPNAVWEVHVRLDQYETFPITGLLRRA